MGNYVELLPHEECLADGATSPFLNQVIKPCRLSSGRPWRPPPSLALWLTLGFCFILPARSQTQPNTLGVVKGRITITRAAEAREEHPPADPLDAYSMHGSHALSLATQGSTPMPVRLSEKAAVYLESEEADRTKYPLPPRNPALNQHHLQFHPQVLPILVGTTVDFPNRDNLFHNVFSYSQPKEFDLGRYPKDDSRSVTFAAPGTVRVYCDIHSQMSATILVLHNPYFASPSDDGTFLIPDVPTGKYTIVFWYGRDAVERRAVTVRTGESTEVDFTY